MENMKKSNKILLFLISMIFAISLAAVIIPLAWGIHFAPEKVVGNGIIKVEDKTLYVFSEQSIVPQLPIRIEIETNNLRALLFFVVRNKAVSI